MVAEIYPEIAFSFYHPIWQLLNFEFKMRREFDLIMLKLHPSVARHFIKIADRSCLGVYILERKYKSTIDTVNCLQTLLESYPLDTGNVIDIFS